jgi:hypothetical protein
MMGEEEDWDDSPESDSESPDSSEAQHSVTEGRRVIRESERKSGSTSRETVYLKRREVLREAPEEDYAPVGVREQMERLKESKKKPKAPLEERWGSRRHRRRGGKWIMLVVMGVGVPLVAIIVGVSLFKKPPPDTKPIQRTGIIWDEPSVSNLPYDSTSPVAWFHENSVGAFEDAVAILERCNEARDPREVRDVLRDEDRTLAKMKESGTGWDPPFFLSDPRSTTWEYGEAGDTGYMWIAGRRADYTKFRAYFVKTDDGLKLDWDASVAWCQVPVDGLVEKAPRHPTLVRTWLGKQPDYDSEIGRGGLYSWYLVLDESKEHFVWAYAPAGSQVDLKIKGLMNYGRMVMTRKNEIRAIVRLVKPGLGFRESEFEITELVTEEWVMP